MLSLGKKSVSAIKPKKKTVQLTSLNGLVTLQIEVLNSGVRNGSVDDKPRRAIIRIIFSGLDVVVTRVK